MGRRHANSKSMEPVRVPRLELAPVEQLERQVPHAAATGSWLRRLLTPPLSEGSASGQGEGVQQERAAISQKR